MSYGSAMERRRKIIGDRELLDSWPSGEVPIVWGLRGLYASRGYSDIVVLPQLASDGEEIPTRLDVYARRNGAQ